MALSYWKDMFGAGSLEQIAAVISLLAIVLASKQIIASWPMDILSSVLYAVVFYRARLFSDTLLQGLFIAMSLYGWYKWQDRTVLKVRHASVKEIVAAAVFAFIYMLISGWALLHFTTASFPFVDSLCSAMSIAATFLAACKVIENWHIWICVDCLYVALFAVKGLYPTAVLYVIFIIIAFYGLLSWRKSEKAND